jgi:hypothetical protein
LYSV